MDRSEAFRSHPLDHHPGRYHFFEHDIASYMQRYEAFPGLYNSTINLVALVTIVKGSI